MESKPQQDHLLSNQLYDKLKFLAQIFLPALGSLYFSLAGLWGLPAAEQVVGTVVVIDTFLGVLLSLNTQTYNQSEAKYDGAIHLGEVDGDQRTFRLELPITAGAIEDAKEIVLKVKPPAERESNA